MDWILGFVTGWVFAAGWIFAAVVSRRRHELRANADEWREAWREIVDDLFGSARK